jgi:hypothetical protein
LKVLAYCGRIGETTFTPRKTKPDTTERLMTVNQRMFKMTATVRRIE